MDDGENARPNGDTDEPTSDLRDNTNVRAMETWDAVIADMEKTAAEYEARGWETLQCHPGDVAVLTDERVGLDVLVPDNEFEQLVALLEDGVAFDESEVFAATEGGLRFLVVVMADQETETSVLFPAYYDTDRADGLRERAREEGELRTYLRRLAGKTVMFTHVDPTPFFSTKEG